ncbi:MAG TPA: selenocysteine-specific translation elongation factor [Vicinamibacterales bacterium]|nr:selenocysteine-specific translation elongation factor [Vicinamibacterales bacterium]
MTSHAIVGTAGHIDHGKSSLVLALTGTDPDRLKEEKARGITIELGFAHTIERGITLSFVDVPGHERFVKNMLAGVGGIDLVMLVVAADESVMPQTREHFEICRLLGIPAGCVVLTKSDLVDADTIELVRLEVRDLVAGSFLEGAPMLAMSSRTGEGLPELRSTLAQLAAQARSRHLDGAPRLPIDRVFSMRGFGTVITGTLVSGRIRIEDELLLQPSEQVVKVRGLQVHARPREEARAGERAAVNVGGVEVSQVARGETLTAPGALSVTTRLDAWLELLPEAKPLAHAARVRFHQGAAELLGRVAVSGGAEIQPGDSGAIRIRLEKPAVLTRGDRFILRAYSPATTIAGGVILDPAPPRTGVRTVAGRARFTKLHTQGDEALVALVEESGVDGFAVAALATRAGVPIDRIEETVGRLVAAGRVIRAGQVLVVPERIAALKRTLVAALGTYHQAQPLLEGMPREEARERIFAHAPQAVFDLVLGELVASRQIVARDRLALATHKLALSDEEARARDRIEQAYRESGLRPPDAASIAAQTGVKPNVAERVTMLLVRQKVLVRLDDLVFHLSALERLKTDVRGLRETGQSATIDVAAFKDRFGITRKFAIPLLEYLDRERITRRVGETRQIIG